MGKTLILGWLLGATTLIVGAVLSSNWYEYRMLGPTDCALFQVARYDPGDWIIAPNQPNDCYMRRARLHLP